MAARSRGLPERLVGRRLAPDRLTLEEIDNAMHRTAYPFKQSCLGLCRSLAVGDPIDHERWTPFGPVPTSLESGHAVGRGAAAPPTGRRGPWPRQVLGSQRHRCMRCFLPDARAPMPLAWHRRWPDPGSVRIARPCRPPVDEVPSSGIGVGGLHIDRLSFDVRTSMSMSCGDTPAGLPGHAACTAACANSS